MYIFFSKHLENSCQVWYNITAQKPIDNKHPPSIGKIAGCIEREKIWQKVHKNLLIINAAAYRYSPFVLSLQDTTESRRGGWGEDCAC